MFTGGTPVYIYVYIVSYDLYFDIVCGKVREQSVGKCAGLVGMML